MEILSNIKPLVSDVYYTWLMQIYQNAKQIHTDRILFPYTKHGVDHSDRVVSHLLELFPSLFNLDSKERLSQTEIFCLVSAIYLHDIGIQLYMDAELAYFCKKCSNGDFPNESTVDISVKDKKDVFVRKYHHALSKYWIFDSVNQKKISPASYVGDKDLATFVGNICESHGIDFEKYIEYTDIESYNGDIVRLGLLCTLLSLGDALDCDGRRIIYDKLKHQDVPLDSRVHWMKHYYVQSIDIKDGHLKIHYRFPKCDDAEREIVYTYYFQHHTKFWIEKCKEIRGKYLYDANVTYDMDYAIRFDSHKDKLTREEYDYVKLGVINIIDDKITSLSNLKQQLQS